VAEAFADVPGLAASVRVGGHPRARRRAISLVEDDAPQAQALVRALFPHAGRSLIVGVTGPPGPGSRRSSTA
jgi:LAO/AO transport system kinase